MSSKKCETNLKTELPTGVDGEFSVKKVTHLGRRTDCNVDSDDHVIRIEIRNSSPVECAVRFVIEIQDDNVAFENIQGRSHSELEVIPPMNSYGSPYVIQKGIEEDSKVPQTDEVELKMKAVSMDIPNPPPIHKQLDVDVN